MEKKIKQIHKQLDRLEREFLRNNQIMKDLSDEGMRGCSRYWKLHEECVSINDQIRDLLNELWKLEE